MAPGRPFSRRGFLGCLGSTVALSNLGWLLDCHGQVPGDAGTNQPLFAGTPLRVQPVLTYHLDQPRERTSWRAYGGLRTAEDVAAETARIAGELARLAADAEFPVDLRPLATVSSDAELQATASKAAGCDLFLVFAASGAQHWLEQLAATKTPNVIFVRHSSGPVYLWYEIAHWRLLRKSEDVETEPNLDVDDVVVDDYADVLWRMRALYGLRNARGTKMLAVGGLAAYSRPAQELGPAHARDVWGCDAVVVEHDRLADALARARSDPATTRWAEDQTEALLAQPNLHLATERRFVVNSFVALKVMRDMMLEAGAANLGVAHCMGGLIPILDTPPCLVLSLLNDEGFTAFCHTDFSHTLPGVLLRWISGKPSFVCNSHFPHHGMVTLAHCAAPRKMNGRDCEPATIMTHYESDYGAATKVEYRLGQTITCLVPNLHCTKWFGFRGRILGSPSFDMCRSQMDVAIEGDWPRLTRELEGFHTVVCYGDYLREVGYALRKLGAVEWRNYSDPV